MLGAMPSREERVVDRGAALGRRLVADLCAEAREARLSAGLGQHDVATSLGISVAQYSRIERGLSPDLTVALGARKCAVLGLRLSVRAYPEGDPIRDAASQALLERLHVRCHPSIAWRTEVTFPTPGDLRAWDATAVRPTFHVGVEAETRLRDVQALDRRLGLKERDGGMDRLILLVLDTRTNRSTIRAYADIFQGRFPVSQAVALQRLAAGEDPGGNALILL
jgi:transcriptional regulator with XRE-family HTH domain